MYLVLDTCCLGYWV